MEIVKKILLAIARGERQFSPEGRTEEGLRRFQPIAQTLLHAERAGYIAQVAAHRTCEHGESLVDSVFVVEGLTHRGTLEISGVLDHTPLDESMRSHIDRFDHVAVRDAWQRALDRRKVDPAGAITASRTLLETVCKHILDSRSISYASTSIELHDLYRLVANELKLSRESNAEEGVKRLLGGCSSIVTGVGMLRNKLGDAHGAGIGATLAMAEEAELAVNVAGSIAVFLMATDQRRR